MLSEVGLEGCGSLLGLGACQTYFDPARTRTS